MKLVWAEAGENIMVLSRVQRFWLSFTCVDQLDGGIVKIELRQQIYGKVVIGQDDLWDKYCRLHKDLVWEKKLEYRIHWTGAGGLDYWTAIA